MSCKQCGACCTPVIRIDLELLEEYIKEAYKHGYEPDDVFKDDYLFVHVHLLKTEIPKDEAIKLNPLIGDWLHPDSHIFICPFLDSNNKCSVHDKLRKNAMCDNFPHNNDGTITKRIHYSRECGYLSNEGR
jgi:Fe-S-cluster containining protein